MRQIENSNGDLYSPGQCYECRAGEHEDEDNDIKMVMLYDDGVLLRKCKMCKTHREIFEEDGYTVKVIA